MIKATRKNGFTLVELIIVTAIASILFSVLTGIFVYAVRTESFILNSKKVVSQIGYAAEYMGRALRMAIKDKAGNCIVQNTNYQITHSGQGIRFINHLQQDKCQEFYLENGIIKFNNGTDILDLTSPDIKVIALRFNVHGDNLSPTDVLQPFVTIMIETQTIGGRAPLKFQTSVSQRNPDIR